jgi:hypothetical protein
MTPKSKQHKPIAQWPGLHAMRRGVRRIFISVVLEVQQKPVDHRPSRMRSWTAALSPNHHNAMTLTDVNDLSRDGQCRRLSGPAAQASADQRTRGHSRRSLRVETSTE